MSESTDLGTTVGVSVDADVSAAARHVLARLTPPVTGEDGDDLDTRVQRFRAPVGPADQTAIHDYRHVELAFDSVWTQLYDHDLADRVAKLYTTVGRVREFAGYEADDPELSTWVGDLESQLDAIEGEADEMEPLEDPSYSVVAAVFPTMNPDLWSWIGPSQRRRFFEFAVQFRNARPSQTSSGDGLNRPPTPGEIILGGPATVLEEVADTVTDVAEGAVDFVSDLVQGFGSIFQRNRD